MIHDPVEEKDLVARLRPYRLEVVPLGQWLAVRYAELAHVYPQVLGIGCPMRGFGIRLGTGEGMVRHHGA
ncbi:MAG: hypothetical protein HOL08_01900 [Opitutae bacterium]|nr:hypothetical protein [Opitutae bacterium]